jgi:hypothetical protein
MRLDTKSRLIKEIIFLTDYSVEEMDLNCTETGNGRRISNRDIYKIYLALCRSFCVQPSVTYTGHKIIEEWCEEDSVSTIEA